MFCHGIRFPRVSVTIAPVYTLPSRTRISICCSQIGTLNAAYKPCHIPNEDISAYELLFILTTIPFIKLRGIIPNMSTYTYQRKGYQKNTSTRLTPRSLNYLYSISTHYMNISSHSIPFYPIYPIHLHPPPSSFLFPLPSSIPQIKKHNTSPSPSPPHPHLLFEVVSLLITPSTEKLDEKERRK